MFSDARICLSGILSARQAVWTRSGIKVIQLFTCSTHLLMKFIMLINVKMPTVVGILTFIGRINITSESFKQEKIIISTMYNFTFDGLKFNAQLIEHEKSLITSGPYQNIVRPHLDPNCLQRLSADDARGKELNALRGRFHIRILGKYLKILNTSLQIKALDKQYEPS